MEAEANQWLGDNHYQAGQYQKSVVYYKQALVQYCPEIT